MNGLRIKNITCPVCHQVKPTHEAISGELIQPAIVELIKKDAPGWDGLSPICFNCLNNLNVDHLQKLIH